MCDVSELLINDAKENSGDIKGHGRMSKRSEASEMGHHTHAISMV